MKCVLFVATVFAIVWLFSAIVSAVGGRIRQFWGRFILAPLGYAWDAPEDSPQEERSSREDRKSHGAHRSHDGHESHHHTHHHHASPSVPASNADGGGAVPQDDVNVRTEARTEDISPLKEAKDRALRKGNVVEAYYWLLRAELAGATDVESDLRKLIAKWISRGCPREYENERSDFTREQGSFARAVLHLRSGKAYTHSCRKIGKLVRKGLPEAKIFAERHKIRDLGDGSHESSHGRNRV